MSKEEKQQYLKDNILHVGYDPSEFSHYMLSLKENGTDISNWTMDELKAIVENFIKIHKDDKGKEKSGNGAKPSNETPDTTDTDDSLEKFFADSKSNNKAPAKENNTNEAINQVKTDNDAKDPENESKPANNLKKRDTMQVKPGASYLSLMDAIFEADEEDKAIEYVGDEEHKNSEQNSDMVVGKEPLRRAAPIDKNDNQLLDNPEDAKVASLTEKVTEENKKAEKLENKPNIIEIPGFKAGKNALSKGNSLKVSISDPQIHDDGLFSRKFITFLVKTPELKYEVRRKDRDFNTLYEYFCKIFPHIYVPTCPEPKKDKMDDNAFEKRAKQLETFINS